MSVSRSRRQFTKEFKLQVLREIEAGKPVAQAAREHEVHPNCISTWRSQLGKYGSEAFQGNGNAYTHEAKVAELERIIDVTKLRDSGQFAAENALLKRALKSLEDSRQSPAPQRGGTNVSTQLRESVRGEKK